MGKNSPIEISKMVNKAQPLSLDSASSRGRLTDIASSLGVSLTTVSDVLHRPAGTRYSAQTGN